MKSSGQMSESIEMGVVLALAGGFMDAYSYLYRDHVFANAQTGNMLLLGIKISERDWESAGRYLFPVLFFAAGITLADWVRYRMKEANAFHWRQVAVLVEIIVLSAVAFFPQSMNIIANSLISLACAIQVESFRKIHGNGIATTMCIGNLRNATQSIYEFWATKDSTAAKRGLLYYGIIFCFVLGAVMGNACIKKMGGKAILVCAGILIIAFVMMFENHREEEAEKKKEEAAG